MSGFYAQSPLKALTVLQLTLYLFLDMELTEITETKAKTTCGRPSFFMPMIFNSLIVESYNKMKSYMGA